MNRNTFLEADPTLLLTACCAVLGPACVLSADAHLNGTTYPSIQSAVDDAVSGDLIEVDPGTYTGGGDAVVRFRGKAITIRATGGPGQTFIDGEGIRRGVLVSAPSGGSAAAVLEGFTILNGSAPDHGGGVLMQGRSRLVNCHVMESGAPVGGGVAVSRDPGDTGTLRVGLEDVSITGNAAVLHGGGLALVGGDAANGLMFAFSGLVEVTDNSCGGRGGGVYSDTATIGLAAASGENGLLISGNRSGGTGGGLHARHSEVDLDGTLPVHVVFNRADANGGGCALVSCPGARLQLALIGDNEASGSGAWGGGLWAKDGSYELVAVEFEGNVAGGGGGGIRNRRSDATLIACRLDRNQALGAGGGGLSSEDSASTRLIDTVVSENLGDTRGGGLQFYRSGLLELQDSIIRDNSALSGTDPDHTYGGGVHLERTPIAARGNTWSGNRAGYAGALYSADYQFGQGSVVSVIEFDSFESNESTYASGGAIGLNGDAVYEIDSCDFSGNRGPTTAICAGGNSGVTVDIADCVFLGADSVGTHGIATAVRLSNADVSIRDSVFRDYGGYGIQVILDTSLDVDGNCFCGNGIGLGNNSVSATVNIGGCRFADNMHDDIHGAWNETALNHFMASCSCGSAPECDIDGDGIVDGADLAALLAAWGTPEPGADLDMDGVVDGVDLAMLLGCWN